MMVLTRVLIIDDDEAMIEMLKMVLEPRAFDVKTTNSAEDGIEAVKQLNPDVIILDLVMPEMDGLQACKAIRQFSIVPILVLSALNNPGLIAMALDEGADDFLSKPVPSGVLVAHLNTLARRARTTREAVKFQNCYVCS